MIQVVTALDNENVVEADVVVANAGEFMAAAEVGQGSALEFDRQTFAKCPFFSHLLQVASRAGHLLRGCRA